MISAWLRSAARSDTPAASEDQPLALTEPNLTISLLERADDNEVLEVGLDLEFSPPWNRRRAAFDPHRVVCRLTKTALAQAAQ
jgi:hypothetical protein